MTELLPAEEEGDSPELVQIVLSRRVRGMLLPQVLLVDRTCLGVKDAGLWPLMTDLELAERVELAMEEGGLVMCEPLTAQSVVYHALDYAKSLGFSPPAEFAPELVGPRPEVLEETPLSHPERPLYVPGPYDDALDVVMRLTDAVGPEGFTMGGALPGGGDDEDWEEEDEDWEEEDEEVASSDAQGALRVLVE